MMKFIRLRNLSAALGATGIVAVGAAALGIFAEPVLGQQPPAIADATATPAATAAPAPANLLSLAEIERRVAATGVRVTELEVRDRIVEVEGRDSSNREIELVVDRRSGEILSRKIED